MKGVWVVTAGSYSDYHIAAIFAEDDKEMADACAAAHDWGDASADFWEFDSFDPSRVVWVFRDYSPSDGESKYGLSVTRMDDKPANREFNKVRLAMDKYGRTHWEGWVKAPTKEHARKIAGEQIARAKAEQEGMR